MTLKLPRVSVSDVMIAFLNAWSPLTIHLFSNDFAPGVGTVLADFTEVTFDGGDAQTLGTRTDAIVGDQGKATWPDVTWTCNDIVEDVYGYYVTDKDGVYRWGERDPAGRFIIAPGRQYIVSPALLDENMP